MQTKTQIEIAKAAGISAAFLSEIISNKKRPRWATAKKLARATNTETVLWLEGTTMQIRKAINGRKN